MTADQILERMRSRGEVHASEEAQVRQTVRDLLDPRLGEIDDALREICPMLKRDDRVAILSEIGDIVAQSLRSYAVARSRPVEPAALVRHVRDALAPDAYRP